MRAHERPIQEVGIKASTINHSSGNVDGSPTDGRIPVSMPIIARRRTTSTHYLVHC